MTGVDLKRRVVHASPGEEIPYDYLVLATGSTNNYHGNEQLAENSIGLKTLEDTHVLLVQSAGRLLTGFSDLLGRYAERILTSRGVEVRMNTHFTGTDNHRVTLSDGGVVAARTVVWAGGVAPVVPSTPPAPETGHSRRVRVDEFLRIPGAQRAYALGDAAGAEQDGKELPMVSAPVITLASWAWYYLRLDRPIRIILQTPPDPIVATLRTPDPDKRHAAPAQIGWRTL